jgi:DnaJ family protein C protein 7
VTTSLRLSRDHIPSPLAQVLSDAKKKEQYDQGVEVGDIDEEGHGHSHGGHGGHGGIDPNMLFHMFMQQQQGGGRGGFR